MNKEERTKRFKSLSSMQRQELILKKMKERGIEVGSGIPNKKYDSEEVYELIHKPLRYRIFYSEFHFPPLCLSLSSSLVSVLVFAYLTKT